ncbi:MAG: Rrf2 family transcriptional regulator [Thermodesulfobacteriota bacterium]
MKLSTRSRYGTRLLMCLARSYGQGPVLLRSVSEEEAISLKYLEQLVIPLRAAGLIKSVRGAKGGYLLAKDPKTIKLIDFLDPLEGGLTLVECTEFPEVCDRATDCKARLLWRDLQETMEEKLSRLTLADIMD